MGVGGWGNHQKDGRGGGSRLRAGGGGGAIYGWQPQNLDLSLMWSREEVGYFGLSFGGTETD